ncbi:MAG TPA: DUF5615 family PIN-like protein [archaeon]|nr:DUF5615 family PIN-like protein [archaeon]
MPKFLVDESTGRKVHEFLESLGFDSSYVGDVMRSATDAEVMETAAKQGRILVTNDKGFGQLVYNLRKPVTGVILLRLEDEGVENKKNVLRQVLEKSGGELENHFIIATGNIIKKRKL